MSLVSKQPISSRNEFRTIHMLFMINL